MRQTFRCMSCRHPILLEYLMEQLDPKLVSSEVLPHFGNVLVEQEMSLMPATQSEALIEKQLRALRREVSEMKTNKRLEHTYRKDQVRLDLVLNEKRQRTAEIRREVETLKAKSQLYGSMNGSTNGSTNGSAKRTAAEQQYCMRCPNFDCRGYVLTQTFCCGTCTDQICEKCHVSVSKHTSADDTSVDTSADPSVDPSVGSLDGTSSSVPEWSSRPNPRRRRCNEEDLANKKLLQIDTKQCPKCLARISKVSGCAQMFCTQCHTAFDWNTLRIEMGVLHNPHYYDWLSAAGSAAASGAEASRNIRTLEEVACGELPNAHVYVDHLHHLIRPSQYTHNGRNSRIAWMTNIYRVLNHIRAVVLVDYSADRVRQNLDHRIGFLLGDIDLDCFRSKVLNREKRRMKITATRTLLEMIVTVLTDFIRQAMYANTATIVDGLIEQFIALRDYFEQRSYQISQIHGGKVLEAAAVFGETRHR